MRVGSRVDNSWTLEGFQRVLSIKPQWVNAGWDQGVKLVKVKLLGPNQVLRSRFCCILSFLLPTSDLLLIVVHEEANVLDFQGHVKNSQTFFYYVAISCTFKMIPYLMTMTFV